MPGEMLALVTVLQLGFFGKVSARPDLAVRMRVGAAHHRTLVLEHLHPGVAGAELSRLRGPAVDHGAQRDVVEVGERRRVVVRPADDTALAAHRLRREQGVGRLVGGRAVGQGREIVGEHERAAVVGVDDAARPLGARTKIAVRVVRHARLDRRLLHLPEPGSLRALRRHQHPTPGERVAAPMRG